MRSLLLVAAALLPVAASAQPVASSSTSPSPWAPPEAVDPARVSMPDIKFTPTAADQGDYEKYFIFNRADNGFATAYADIAECDNYARGRPAGNSGSSNIASAVASQFGLVGGVVGGMIAGAIVEAQMAAERRKLRRGIMRTCMGFKGYSAFGLPKSL